MRVSTPPQTHITLGESVPPQTHIILGECPPHTHILLWVSAHPPLTQIHIILYLCCPCHLVNQISHKKTYGFLVLFRMTGEMKARVKTCASQTSYIAMKMTFYKTSYSNPPICLLSEVCQITQRRELNLIKVHGQLHKKHQAKFITPLHPQLGSVRPLNALARRRSVLSPGTKSEDTE